MFVKKAKPPINIRSAVYYAAAAFGGGREHQKFVSMYQTEKLQEEKKIAWPELCPSLKIQNCLRKL